MFVVDAFRHRPECRSSVFLETVTVDADQDLLSCILWPDSFWRRARQWAGSVLPPPCCVLLLRWVSSTLLPPDFHPTNAWAQHLLVWSTSLYHEPPQLLFMLYSPVALLSTPLCLRLFSFIFSLCQKDSLNYSHIICGKFLVYSISISN